MSHPYARERVENWAADFCASDAARAFPPGAREPSLLATFLLAACSVRDVEPEDVEDEDLKTALLQRVARLNLSPEAREHAPALCGAFLEFLAAEGRLSGGRAKGAYVCALRGAFAAATGQEDQLARRGRKIDRNGPCPCGSGRKYKKCCMNLLEQG